METKVSMKSKWVTRSWRKRLKMSAAEKAQRLVYIWLYSAFLQLPLTRQFTIWAHARWSFTCRFFWTTSSRELSDIMCCWINPPRTMQMWWRLSASWFQVRKNNNLCTPLTENIVRCIYIYIYIRKCIPYTPYFSHETSIT